MKLFAVGLAALVALLAGPTPAAAAASHALIQGSGSSWAANAVNQWVADVANQGLQVVFTANGSGQGRKDYANRTTDFGGIATEYWTKVSPPTWPRYGGCMKTPDRSVPPAMIDAGRTTAPLPSGWSAP